MPFRKIKESLGKIFGREKEEEYLEVDLGQEAKKNKVIVKLFVLKRFDDVTEILNTIREGYTIAVIDIRPLKQKDIIELKRAIAKIKKTTEALEGDIAGFGENSIIVTPSFAEISKPKRVEKKEEIRAY